MGISTAVFNGVCWVEQERGALPFADERCERALERRALRREPRRVREREASQHARRTDRARKEAARRTRPVYLVRVADEPQGELHGFVGDAADLAASQDAAPRLRPRTVHRAGRRHCQQGR